MDALITPRLLAEVESSILLRSLVIALVLVVPYAVVKQRQVRAHRAALSGDPGVTAQNAIDGADRPSRPSLEEVINGVPAAAEQARAVGTVTVTVPNDVTVGGRDGPADLVDTLLRDALRRSGLTIAADSRSSGGRVIECHPTASP